jgi:hypothetical protein
MKKLLVLAFVVSSLVACGKSKPAATTPTPAPDAKMEGAPATEETKTETPAADPCAAKDPCAAPKN